MTDRARLEGVRESFSRATFALARKRALEALELVAPQIRPGMTEPEAQAILAAALAENDAAKPWHRPVIRFGSDTIKAFAQPSNAALALGDDDIFFLDIGPVFGGYEADLGRTFVTGSDPELRRCADDAEAIYLAGCDAWRHDGLTGTELYDFATREAERRDWTLNLDLDGHRLGDFPHHAFYRGGLSEIDFTPSPGLWVLEIAIRHPERDFGAFYEDTLLAESATQ